MPFDHTELRATQLSLLIESATVVMVLVIFDVFNKRMDKVFGLSETNNGGLCSWILFFLSCCTMGAMIYLAQFYEHSENMIDFLTFGHVWLGLFSLFMILNWLDIAREFKSFTGLIAMKDLSDFVPNCISSSANPMIYPVLVGTFLLIALHTVSFVLLRDDSSDLVLAVLVCSLPAIFCFVDLALNVMYVFILTKYVLYSGECIDPSGGISGFKRTFNVLFHKRIYIFTECAVHLLLVAIMLTLLFVAHDGEFVDFIVADDGTFLTLIVPLYLQIWLVNKFYFRTHNYSFLQRCCACGEDSQCCCLCCETRFNDIVMEQFQFASMQKYQAMEMQPAGYQNMDDMARVPSGTVATNCTDGTDATNATDGTGAATGPPPFAAMEKANTMTETETSREEEPGYV